jgi:hypothetical protein
MPTLTYTPLANITLSSTAASVTFSSISQAYRDLVLVMRGTASTGQLTCIITLNGDTSGSYAYVVAGGNGTSANNVQASGNTGMWLGQLNAFINGSTSSWNAVSNFMDYSATDKQKFVLTRENEVGLGSDMYAHRWINTSAITTINVATNSQAWGVGSSFALYGIAA